MARSTVLRFLYRSSSKPGGRPPREPLRRRVAWLSAFSGIVCRLPRASKVLTAGAVAVSLIGRDAARLLARPARPEARNPDLLQYRHELGAVRALTGGDDQGQRSAAPVGAQVDLAGRAAPRAAQALASCTTSTRRSTRLCHMASAWCSVTSSPFEAAGTGGDQCGRRRHDGARARSWSRPRCPSRCRQPRPPRPGPAAEGVPRCRRQTIAGDVRRPFSTARTAPVDLATAPRSVPGAKSRRSPAGGHATCRTDRCSPAGTAAAVPTRHPTDHHAHPAP